MSCTIYDKHPQMVKEWDHLATHTTCTSTSSYHQESGYIHQSSQMVHFLNCKYCANEFEVKNVESVL